MTDAFFGEGLALFRADCRTVLPAIADNSVDAIVTDPPYEIGFMNKDFDKRGIAYDVEMWRECLRVLKPGGYIVVAGSSRTHHRVACAIEDAGFEIRDTICHLFGQGFPKGLDISKVLVKSGQEEAARQWQGWNVSLKPAAEFWTLARKPLSEKTVAANMQKWSTGGINVDACRVGTSRGVPASLSTRPNDGRTYGKLVSGQPQDLDPNMGRWPPNVVLTHSAACRVTGTRTVRANGSIRDDIHAKAFRDVYSDMDNRGWQPHGNGDGTETVEAWECADDCPVKALDAQSPGSPRYFPQFNCTPGDLVFFPVESDAWEQPGEEFIKDASTFAGRKTENNADSSPIDGSGSKSTEQSLKDTKSITEITMPSITTSVISCASLPNGMTTITSGSESNTGILMAQSKENVSAAANGNHSPSITYDEPELGMDTASPAQKNTDENGLQHTGMSSTPEDEREKPPVSQADPQFTWSPEYDAPFMYTAKAPGRERPRIWKPDCGCETDEDWAPEASYCGTCMKSWKSMSHSTVKPLALLRWLARLVTPPGGLVLDPFCGTGTTLFAAHLEGFRAIGCDSWDDAIALSRVRLKDLLEDDNARNGQ